MDNQKIIIALMVIIVALLVCMVFIMPNMNRQDTDLAIKDYKINAGDSLVVLLKDDNGNPLSNQTVKIKLTGKGGKEINEDVSTNSKGKAKLKVKEKGKYGVECGFEGDGQYAPSSISANLTVKNPTTKVISQEKTQTATHSSKYASDGSIYPEYGPEVDAQGITREEAISKNMHYIEMTVDGDRPGEYVTVGGYVAYDPNAGCYHT